MTRSKIKAIETHYAGCRFRSRLEARWAVLFDYLGITWDYEPEGFDLGEDGYYLPDFWLSFDDRYGRWVEIKPSRPTEEELRKCRALCRMNKNSVHLLSGPIWKENRSKHIFMMCSDDEPLGVSEIKGDLWGLLETYYWEMRHQSLDDEIMRAAIEAARSARFEFGESG